MENKITRLCGGYYRSFTQFKQQVENMEESMTFLQDCARFLQESSTGNDDPKKIRFTHLFFETYGKLLAGACGCSGLILDHQLVKIKHREFFIDLMHASLTLGVMDCYSDHLARNLHAVFDVGFTLSTLQRKLRADTRQANQFHEKLKHYKNL